MNSLLAWHGTKADGTTQHLKVKETVGVKTFLEGNTILCKNALHGSVRAMDMLLHSEGLWIKRTLHEGVILRDIYKIGSSERTVVAEADATQVISDWAFWCANRAVHIHAVTVLMQAGMTEEAEKLASLEAITDIKSANIASDAAHAVSNILYTNIYTTDSVVETDITVNTVFNAAINSTSCAACAANAAAAAKVTPNSVSNAAANTAVAAANDDEMYLLNAELERRLFVLMGLTKMEVI